jgi:hypothetical protein
MDFKERGRTTPPLKLAPPLEQTHALRYPSGTLHLASGATIEDAAAKLYLSEGTVHNHSTTVHNYLSPAIKKPGTAGRAGRAIAWKQHGKPNERAGCSEEGGRTASFCVFSYCSLT